MKRAAVSMGAAAFLSVASLALAQAPAAPPAPTPATDYVVVRLETTIARPAAAVWARAGGFCDIYLLRGGSCVIVSGDGTPPTVRRLGGTTFEHMIAQTPLSYTYGQIVGGMKAYDYHVTLAAAPVSATSAKLTYAFIYDQALLPADQREATRTRLQGFQNNLDQARIAIEKEAPGR